MISTLRRKPGEVRQTIFKTLVNGLWHDMDEVAMAISHLFSIEEVSELWINDARQRGPGCVEHRESISPEIRVAKGRRMKAIGYIRHMVCDGLVEERGGPGINRQVRWLKGGKGCQRTT